MGVLLQTIKNVRAGQDTLVNVFARIEQFFQRLVTYIEVQPTEAMTDIIVKIMVEVLLTLGIVTKAVGQGRTRKFLNKLAGKNDVEYAIQRLDKLTQEAQTAAKVLTNSSRTDDDIRGEACEDEVINSKLEGITHSRQWGGPRPGSKSESQVWKVPLRELPTLNRVKSAPQKLQSVKDSDDSLQSPHQIFRAQSSISLYRRNLSSPKTWNAEHSMRPPPPRRSEIYPYSGRTRLVSMVRQALPEWFKFRILVVGKRGSGKSSLVNAIFKVDVTAAPESALGRADIDVEFRPADNRYLIVHECSGLDPQTTDSQDLQTIRDFISRRTDASRSPPERLHAVWICVPASDAIDGRLGDGVEEILGMRNVPVILVFTKFDVVVSQVSLDISSGDPEYQERARAKAQTMYEDSCRRIFHKEPKDVPAEIVSARFIDLIENLVVTTDRFITDPRASSARAGAQGTKQRVRRFGAVPLAWSAAVRVNRDTTIQATIEYVVLFLPLPFDRILSLGLDEAVRFYLKVSGRF
ncbi:hypothetical protein EI94DRAFT_1315775 [Lactarius quietus]|nr:hypothetical protein EI94DRAFT_1315775 [Lactarius quietus]